MKYDYIIINYNYSGLILSYYLSKINKTVLLIDNNKTHAQYMNQNLINFNNFLSDININITDISGIYLNFSKGEMLSIYTEMSSLFFNKKHGSSISLESFLNERGFTNDSKNKINDLCSNILNKHIDNSTLFDLLFIINNHSLDLYYNFANISKSMYYDKLNVDIIDYKELDIVDDTHNILSINGHEAYCYISDIKLNYDNLLAINNNNNYIETQVFNALLMLHKLEPVTTTMIKAHELDNITDIVKFVLLLTFIINMFNKI
jgi:hypothetical protein